MKVADVGGYDKEVGCRGFAYLLKTYRILGIYKKETRNQTHNDNQKHSLLFATCIGKRLGSSESMRTFLIAMYTRNTFPRFARAAAYAVFATVPAHINNNDPSYNGCACNTAMGSYLSFPCCP